MPPNSNTIYPKSEVPLNWFGKTLWRFTPFYIELIIISIFIRLIGLVEPFIFQVLIDRILPFQREESLIVVIAVFAAVCIFHIGFQVLSSLLGVLTANRVVRELGSRIFDHLFRLPLSHFRRYPVGEIIARISETSTIKNFLVGTTTGIFLDLIFVVVYLGILFTLSPELTWIVLISLPLQAAVYFILGPFIRHRLRIQFDTGAYHQSQMIENISGIVAIKAMRAEAKVVERLNASLLNTLNAGYRIATLRIFSSQVNFFINRFVTISIIFIGATLVFSGKITLGQLIAFHLIAEKVTSPIANFSKLWESWQNIRISRQRLGDIINTPQEPFNLKPRLAHDTKPEINFINVSFEYNTGIQILNNLNFIADPYSLNLIIGPSGIGKSTFGRLAAGIEEPTTGAVMLGGENISQFDPMDVRSKITYVPQEPYLFTGTLRENLLLGVDTATDLDIEKALKIAAADKMVAQMPFGLDTPVGERGSSLSGGQRQRITIARSILLAPKVMILDEPTSALDHMTQLQMVESLAELKQHMTLIIITHRPDVFINVDQTIDFRAAL